ncbi:MAG: FG-GAP-like repeat-containing protein, partial [Thermoanaerobaculia bacterium]
TPAAIVADDLNRDGKLDLAVANSGSHNVSLLLGNGSGSFAAAVHYAAGTNPSGIAAGDFTDDGIVDLAIANKTSNNLSILQGIDGVVFAPMSTTAAGSGATAVALGDFNRDGKPDFAVANHGAATFSILLNTCPVSDLTVTKTHTGNFLQGETGKTFTITVQNIGLAPTTGVVTVTDTLPVGLVATNITGSGWTCTPGTLTCTRSDSLAGGASYPAIVVTVKVNSGAPPSVTNSVSVTGGDERNTQNNTASDSVTIVGRPDLTVTSTHAGSFLQGRPAQYSLIVNNGGGLATSGTVTVTDVLPSGLTATAISGFGWSCTLGTLTCTRSNALAAYSSYPPITLTVNVGANAPGTVTNTVSVSGGADGNAGNNTSTDLTVVWSTQTCASFGNPAHYNTVVWSPRAVVVGDFNGDGKPDVAAAHAASPNTVTVLLGNGDGTLGTPTPYPGGSYAEAIATGDFNNDGKTDLVAIADAIVVLLGAGDGTFGAPIVQFAGTFDSSTLAVADLNRDGNADLVVTDFYDDIRIYLGTGN